MFSKSRQRSGVSVNASSMADIAFLLLIFFLVTTTIDTEKGIRVKLPPISNEPPKNLIDRNVLSVRINFENAILVEGERLTINSLRALTKLHIMNPDRAEEYAISPDQASISLQNDRNTNYHTYLSVYNELKGAYNEIWEEQAITQYGLPFQELTRRNQLAIKKMIPLVISEGEVADLMDES